MFAGIIRKQQHNDGSGFCRDAAFCPAVEVRLCRLNGADAEGRREIFRYDLIHDGIVHRIHLVSWRITGL
jgi:hypothetical protein